MLGSFWREPPVEFKFGDHKLEIVNLYRYLGIQETLNGHDYSEFIGAKLKSVRARLAKVRRVGGYIDGLDPFNMRRLYLSQIRPIIEFGATTIPYKNTWLTKLEDMQFECLRQLFGFFPKTKKETILTLSGVTRIRTRVAQLKLSFYNKLKTFDDGLYLKALMRDSFKPDRRSGLGHDIGKIYDEFMGFPKFQEEMEDFLDVNHVNDNYKMFNKSIKSMLEEIDFEYCLEKKWRTPQTFVEEAVAKLESRTLTFPRKFIRVCAHYYYFARNTGDKEQYSFEHSVVVTS